MKGVSSMIDWTESMTQTFEYYLVDTNTWKDKKQIRNIKSSTINRDSESETLGSATIDFLDSLDECYVRIYLICIQNGITHKLPLGTFLIQTPSPNFDGKVNTISADAYTPLLELKEKPTPIGYSIYKDENIMDIAYRLIRENARAPVVETQNNTKLLYDFVANTDDNWLSFVTDLIANAKYSLDLDEFGKILFAPKQDIVSLQPTWTYTDDNCSILYPDISVDRDLYGIPNVVEVLYSTNNGQKYSRKVNNNSNSPVSTLNRGREIIHRVTDPTINGISSDTQDDDAYVQHLIDEYAEQLLRDLSSLEYTLSYTHGYCPVRVGDCVRINYSRFGLKNVKAKVISQTIKCEPGCPVSEKAVYTINLWR